MYQDFIDDYEKRRRALPTLSPEEFSVEAEKILRGEVGKILAKRITNDKRGINILDTCL